MEQKQPPGHQLGQTCGDRDAQALLIWVLALACGSIGGTYWVQMSRCPPAELLRRDRSPLQKQLLPQAEHLSCFSGSLPPNRSPVKMHLVLCFLHQHLAYTFLAGRENLSLKRCYSRRVAKNAKERNYVPSFQD